MLKNSEIYRKWDKVVDDTEKLQLQNDRPLCLCFGWVKINGVYKYFPNSVVVRFTMDDAYAYQEFPLVNDEYAAHVDDTTTGKTFPNIFECDSVIESISEGIPTIAKLILL